ncbi:hypothetical protein F5Y11DRAFT_358797 [Daldinia sp. FL1419]|nr:hypothetical protein F5Y11DRAFT_358797 [Daldinia sp. FL1419]
MDNPSSRRSQRARNHIGDPKYASHPIIQDVKRERLRHEAELRVVKRQLAGLRSAQDNLIIENEQLKNLMHHLPDSSTLEEFASRIQGLEKQNDTLEDEIHRLKGLTAEDVEELRAKHFATHARNSITIDQIVLEYRNFADEIISLIYEWVKPLLDDEPLAADIIEQARKTGAGKEVLEWMEAFPDIARLSSYQLSAEYVILAIVMRWLDQRIFSADLCTLNPVVLDTISGIEDSLYNHVTPRQRALEIRRWRQTTYYALIQHPDYKSIRMDHEETLAKEIESIFSFLPEVTRPNMRERIRDVIIFRALELNELFVTSIDHFIFQFWNFLPNADAVVSTAENLFEERERFEFEDLLDGSNKVELEEKTLDEIVRRLDPVCCLIPAVFLINADDFSDATLCCKSYLVAAWGLPKNREKKAAEQTPGFLNGLLLSE